MYWSIAFRLIFRGAENGECIIGSEHNYNAKARESLKLTAACPDLAPPDYYSRYPLAWTAPTPASSHERRLTKRTRDDNSDGLAPDDHDAYSQSLTRPNKKTRLLSYLPAWSRSSDLGERHSEHVHLTPAHTMRTSAAVEASSQALANRDAPVAARGQGFVTHLLSRMRSLWAQPSSPQPPPSHTPPAAAWPAVSLNHKHKPKRNRTHKTSYVALSNGSYRASTSGPLLQKSSAPWLPSLAGSFLPPRPSGGPRLAQPCPQNRDHSSSARRTNPNTAAPTRFVFGARQSIAEPFTFTSSGGSSANMARSASSSSAASDVMSTTSAWSHSSSASPATSISSHPSCRDR